MDSGEEIGSAHLLTQSEAYWALTHQTGQYLLFLNIFTKKTQILLKYWIFKVKK